jgi:phosphoglycolate phosphatase
MDRYEGYDAVVFDLDGTVVHLDVDWARVDAETATILESHDVPPTETAWGALDAADEDAAAAVAELLADHERRGAEHSWRLPAAADLRALAESGRPTAVCSLNCEAAVRTALAEHDLTDAADVVVGRDTVGSRKPDPGPLLAALRPTGVPPARSLFVGDSESDELTATRAGVDFAYASHASSA